MYNNLRFIYHLNRHRINKYSNFIRLPRTITHNSKSEEEQTKNEKSFYNQYKNHSIICLSVMSVYLIYNSIVKLKFQTVNAVEKKNESPCGIYKEGLVTYTAEEVNKHDSKKNRIWITFKEGVYDITEFVEKHPGGSEKIMMAAGGSIEPFWKIFANHNQLEIYALLESMRIGNLAKQDILHQTKDENNPYSCEPPRHKALRINGHKPFCAEPPPQMLIESFLTPTELFYVRNHLPVPDIDIKDYELEVAIENNVEKTLTFNDLQKYPKYSITSAIMCGGNRRSEMNKAKSVRGLSWGVAAIGNATWTGARLCDVLEKLNIDESKYSHVQFEGSDLDPSGTPYSASIPICKAMDPRADVLLAYEMNGEPISRDHGFPIRVIVPGVVGARNVKWLTKITVSKNESPSQWQQGDYKGFSPSVDWDTVDFKTSPAIQEMPVTSAICTPQENEKVIVKDGQIKAKGYAWSGGGRKIIRVDVTADKGETWHVAKLVATDKKAPEGRHWGWTLWEVDLPINSLKKEVEIWSKAVDSSYNVQPERFKNIWNLRGLLCNAYHRIRIELVN